MRVSLLLLLAPLCGCSAVSPGPWRANLSSGVADSPAFVALADAFAANNPGHSLAFSAQARELRAADLARIVLVQAGAGTVRIDRPGSAMQSSDAAVGDVFVLAKGAALQCSAPMDLLVFGLPSSPGDDVPAVIRPDWDPRITDTPGGCATDSKAYRRVLLTWRGENGPYTFHGLNVHRVRIDDSFTHYHPVVGGFDEFYLVQAVREGARLLTSPRVADIEHPETIRREEVPTLFASMPLHVGDLVYLPRGLAHRGLGGVLAQVITVPGFVPGAEIGIDHHLHAINERLGLVGDAALPLHAEGATKAIVR